MKIMQFARELKSYLEDYGLYTITRSQESGMVLEVKMDGKILFKLTINAVGDAE